MLEKVGHDVELLARQIIRLAEFGRWDSRTEEFQTIALPPPSNLRLFFLFTTKNAIIRRVKFSGAASSRALGLATGHSRWD